LLTRCDDRICILDTLALGRPGIVAAYVIRGKENALVDMGYASSAGTVLMNIKDSEIGVDGIDYLLPTHVHLDHSGACGALAENFASASIRVHPKGERHLVDPSKLWEGAGELFGTELMRLYGRPEPINGSRVRAIGDGDEISLGSGLTLRSIWTPGHASHHLSYELEGTGTVFTGDVVGLTYPAFPVLIPTTPPTSFNLDSAIASLQRIKQVSPKRLLTPHYGVIHDAVSSIDANIRILQDWTAKINKMLRNSLSTNSIITTLIDAIARERAHPDEPLPDYVAMSIRVSVLGVVRHLESPVRKAATKGF
jgi:glyoxylase-like metal-dependent hydrolase (beta-lactamase superfamily II)